MMSRPVSREPAGGGGRPAAAAGGPPEGKAPPVIERGEDRLAHGAAGEGPRAGRRAGAGNLTIVRDGQRPSTWLPSTRAATRLPAAVRRRDSVPAARTCPIREGTGQHRRAATSEGTSGRRSPSSVTPRSVWQATNAPSMAASANRASWSVAGLCGSSPNAVVICARRSSSAWSRTRRTTACIYAATYTTCRLLSVMTSPFACDPTERSLVRSPGTGGRRSRFSRRTVRSSPRGKAVAGFRW